MQSRNCWWAAAGLLILTIGCDKVGDLNITLNANSAGDAECANYLKGIKTAQIAYDAAFDDYIECDSWPDDTPGKSLREWPTGSNFDTLGWAPDGDVRGSYSVETESTDFTARCVHDADGDGEQSVWEASKTSNPQLVAGPESGFNPSLNIGPSKAGADDASSAAPPENGAAGCLGEDASAVSIAGASLKDAAAALENADNRELWVTLTQAQLCNEAIQDALTDGRRNIALEITNVAFNSRALASCLESVDRKVCAITLPSNATDDALESVSGLDGLTNLIAKDTQITDSGLAYLAYSDGLTHLDLSDTAIGDAGLAYLAGLSALTVLRTDGTKATASGLAQLSDIEGLNQGPSEADEVSSAEDESAGFFGGFISSLKEKTVGALTELATEKAAEADDDTGLPSAEKASKGMKAPPGVHAKEPAAEKAASDAVDTGAAEKSAVAANVADFFESVTAEPMGGDAPPPSSGLTKADEAALADAAKAMEKAMEELAKEASKVDGGDIGALLGTATPPPTADLGEKGSSLGGGGTAARLDRRATRGRGAGAKGYGAGGGNFGAKGGGAIGAIGGDPIILGALDKSLIDAVIRRHMNQIKYCYSRELTKRPGLAGKITVKFTIAGDGTVSSATTKRSTLGSPTVENCINGRFMRFKFPEPRGNGIVIVSYPFVFQPG